MLGVGHSDYNKKSPKALYNYAYKNSLNDHI